eukprot:TRINITY_DN20781_c0_g1_i1.p1 TRINITY_DN20781_c0_g1~~TRINITY_DN20781_c0_g1_i1.p1  ORF type:complete len:415 (+),score=156.20 TRINITY_DN20781_c0_g1_i1:197-1441(+)
MQADYDIFKDSATLRREGALLLESSGSRGGRVVFSLQEVPLRRKFMTSNGNFIRRDKDDTVSLWSADSRKVMTLPVSVSASPQNKDHLFWAHSQNDLLLFDDAKQLASTGAVLTDPVSGKTKEIRALTDLPIGVKYFTEHANIIQRLSNNEIMLGDKTLYVNPPTASDSSSSPCSSEDEKPSSEEFVAPKGVKGHADEELAVAERDASFPCAKECTLVGRGFHMDRLTLNVVYAGGVEGNSIVRWERCVPDTEEFTTIVGARGATYQPSMMDIGTEVRASYTPVRADGVTGAIVFSNAIEINIDPEVAAEVRSNLALSSLMFKVLMSNSGGFEKRSIVVGSDKLKIRKRRQTMAKCAFGSALTVMPAEEHDCEFSLGFGADEFYSFLAPSCYQRDIIVLTLQSFNINAMEAGAV